MNRRAIGVYIATQIAPTLQKGDVVILDDLAVYKSVKAERPSAAIRLPARGADKRKRGLSGGARKQKGRFRAPSQSSCA